MGEDYIVQTELEHERPYYMAFADGVGTYGEGKTVEAAIADFWEEVAYDIRELQSVPPESLDEEDSVELDALLELCRRNGKEDA